jgi:glutathione S-transferase
MIKVHHLNNSRSQRIVWALEELGAEYEIVHYQRDSETRLAPETLQEVHALGKAPVVEDGDVVIAESAAAIDYLARTYGEGRYAPAYDDARYLRYNELMHYVEGSAILPLMLGLYVSRLGEAGAPLGPRIMSETALHLGYLAKQLGDKPYFMGEEISAVDWHVTFIFEAANVRGGLAKIPNLLAYLQRMQARPAYKKAIERGGVYQLGG